jgi:UDP-glucose 4-epimerase
MYSSASNIHHQVNLIPERHGSIRVPKAVGGVFNLGGPPPVALQRLAELLVEINGGGGFVVREFPVDRKKIDIGDYYADDRLIAKKLGWKWRTDLRTALARTLEFYRAELKNYL